MTQSIVDTDTFSSTAKASTARGTSVVLPEPEVTVMASRRRFSAQYKRQILEQADRCSAPGEIGALLRREGLYSSHLSTVAPPARAGRGVWANATQAWTQSQ